MNLLSYIIGNYHFWVFETRGIHMVTASYAWWDFIY